MPIFFICLLRPRHFVWIFLFTFHNILWSRYCYYIHFTKKTKTRGDTLILLNFQSKVMHLLFCFKRAREKLGKGQRRRGRETLMWERYINQLSLKCSRLGDPTCSPGMCPDGNRASDLLLCGMTPSQQSHTGQGHAFTFKK